MLNKRTYLGFEPHPSLVFVLGPGSWLTGGLRETNWSRGLFCAKIITSQYHHGHRLQQTGPVLRKKIKRGEKNNNYVILFSESLNAG